jgi:transcription elongation factor Elf1
LKNYAVLDKAFKKLATENKELQKKHEKTVLELKPLRNDKETVEKQNNSLSVALKSCKKEAEVRLIKFDNEIDHYKAELKKHLELNSVPEDEAKKAKKGREKDKTEK